MTQYINKSALVAEIKRCEKICDNYMVMHQSTIDYGIANAKKAVCQHFKRFLDTLEVKEVDLEKETKKWWKEHLHLNPENELWMDAHQSVVFAKHFFELGMSVNNKA